MDDLHTALKAEVVGRYSSKGVNFVHAKLQWGKERIGFSLHAEPTSFSAYGVQTTDFLADLGFVRSACSFFPGKKCYVAKASEQLPLREFTEGFSAAFDYFETAGRHLDKCGLNLDQPEGWAFFTGKPSSGRDFSARRSPSGDCHRSPQSEELNRSEDEHFTYVMSWIEGGPDKGWVFHYCPKHPPLSAEATAALDFLSISRFPECPFFEFDPCRFSFYPFITKGTSFFDNNAHLARDAFASHATDFSPAIRALSSSNGIIGAFGCLLLPTWVRSAPPPAGHPTAAKPAPTPSKEDSSFEFDVAISFAGSERGAAERLSTIVRDAGYSVFYDNFYPAQLWGKDLVVFFDDIYRKRARFCLILISAEYCDRMWTNQERRSAQARALQQRNEYILPVKVDETELPGLPPTIGYLSLRERSLEDIAQLLIEKLSQP